jgi:hypothetical protein
MKPYVKESVNKVKNALVENEYQTAKQLAEICRMKPCSVHRIIRFMRLAGIGVLTTNKGYVLSEFAKKRDDVNFIRRLYGRRTSDFIAIRAAEGDIRHRWNSIEEKQQFKLIMEPLSVDLSNSKGMKILLNKTTNSKGI